MRIDGFLEILLGRCLAGFGLRGRCLIFIASFGLGGGIVEGIG